MEESLIQDRRKQIKARKASGLCVGGICLGLVISS